MYYMGWMNEWMDRWASGFEWLVWLAWLTHIHTHIQMTETWMHQANNVDVIVHIFRTYCVDERAGGLELLACISYILVHLRIQTCGDAIPSQCPSIDASECAYVSGILSRMCAQMGAWLNNRYKPIFLDRHERPNLHQRYLGYITRH